METDRKSSSQDANRNIRPHTRIHTHTRACVCVCIFKKTGGYTPNLFKPFFDCAPVDRYYKLCQGYWHRVYINIMYAIRHIDCKGLTSTLIIEISSQSLTWHSIHIRPVGLSTVSILPQIKRTPRFIWPSTFNSCGTFFISLIGKMIPNVLRGVERQRSRVTWLSPIDQMTSEGHVNDHC